MCVSAKQNSANLHVWNIGTVAPVDCGSVVKNRIIAPQTANFAQSPAMSSAQLNSAILVGVDAAVSACLPEGLFIGGEMG
ncbi:nicotinate-nucleotide--dimethylbenzimidazole phosphoribosyltransferase, partial [Neptunomonas phycophila]|uniref:nicotinate-nucleotide--dimethylbenzimidazole phosphoribosyltransferase n=1 Tax=Neptunomonas phycophila TaxID=1572645 RepID=UPI00349F9E04